jgi:hypothetical protein
MATLADLMFAEHLAEVLGEPEAVRWTIVRQEGLVIHVSLSPRSAIEERSLARLGWSDYPGRLPASVVFLDPATGAKGDTKCWPNIPGVRAPNDICACWTAEGFGAHPEWLTDPNMAWPAGENPILTQLRYLQLELDHHYQGRCQ